MLCMSTESFPTQLQPRPRLNRPLEPRLVSDEARRDAEEIRSRDPIHDKHAINTAVKWMQPLTLAWMGVIREHRAESVLRRPCLVLS